MITAAKCVAIVLAYAGFFVVAGSKTLARYVCLRCASIRTDVQVRPFDIKVATIRGVETPTWITEIIQWLDPGPCAHQWARKRPMSDRLPDLLASETLAAAMKDDPARALELIRSALRGDIPGAVPPPRPADSDPDATLRRWLEEFPLKPVRGR